MIVPRDRLIFWAGITVMPFAGIGFMLPEAAGPSALIVGIFLLLVSVDAAAAFRRLDGVTPEFPAIIRMSKNIEGNIPIALRNAGARKGLLRMGLAFPPEIRAERDVVFAELPEKDKISHFQWSCTPSRRGRYTFDRCFIESASYLGFWSVRRSAPASFEVRVYPDLSIERKRLAALFLNRGMFGVHAQRQVGQGRGFEKLREYVYGDSYDHIHWKATAKRGHPVTKVFQIERTQEVYAIIDTSRLSGRVISPASPTLTKGSAGVSCEDTFLDKFITAAMVMGVAARRQGDLFGVVGFSDKAHNFIRAKSGMEHYRNCRKALYQLQPRIVTPDFDDLSSFIGMKIRRRALLIFLTNLDDPVIAENFLRNMDLLGRKHIIVVAMIRPEGIGPLFSNDEVKTVNDIYGNLGGHMLWHNLLELEKELNRKGVRFSLREHERLCLDLISRYMEIKQRQLI